MNKTKNQYQDEVIDALYEGDIEQLKRLFETYHITEYDKSMSLLEAIWLNESDMAKYILTKTESVMNWPVLLRMTIQKGNTDLLNYFIREKFIDLSIFDDGNDLIRFAFKHGRTDIAEILLSNGVPSDKITEQEARNYHLTGEKNVELLNKYH